MTVRLDGAVIRLEGQCHVEEAEALLTLVLADRGRTVDLTGCARLHGALAQVLISYAVPTDGAPEDSFVRDYVIPGLRRARRGGEET